MIRRGPRIEFRRFSAVAGLLLVLAAPAAAQDAALKSGPMVGFSTMRETLLWAQTTAPAEVRFRWWDLDDPEVRGESAAVPTGTEHVAKVVAAGLEPGRRYGYQVDVNGEVVERAWPLEFQTQALWHWRAFRIAVGSCLYVNEPVYDRPGEPYGGDPRILGAILAADPDAMLWLGDNTYLREVDWDSREGILHRYGHTRALPELQPLLGSVHHYATWDDHDYGPNNSDRSYWAKHLTREAFDLFWGNPPFGGHGLGGVTNTFKWGDVQFFLLDDRWDRSPEDRTSGERTILGDAQFEWPIDALAFSSAGDRHHTELTRLDRPGAYPLYDLTVSPLTAGISSMRDEPNTLRVEGTVVQDYNFATLDFSGPRTDRALEVTIRDADGAPLWSRTVRAAELRYPREARP